MKDQLSDVILRWGEKMGVVKAVTNTSNLPQTSAQAILKQQLTYYSLGTLELLFLSWTLDGLEIAD